MAFFGVGGVLEMIVGPEAPSSLDMSPYRAVRTHFRSNSMNFLKKSLGPGHQVLDQVLGLVLGPCKIFSGIQSQISDMSSG